MVLAMEIQTEYYEIFYMISAHIWISHNALLWAHGLDFNFSFVSVHKNAKKEQGQYQAILTGQAWSIKGLLYGQKITPKNFTFAGIK